MSSAAWPSRLTTGGVTAATPGVLATAASMRAHVPRRRAGGQLRRDDQRRVEPGPEPARHRRVARVAHRAPRLRRLVREASFMREHRRGEQQR